MFHKKLGSRLVPQFSSEQWCLFSFNNQILKYQYANGCFEKLAFIGDRSNLIKYFFKEKILRNYIYKRFFSRNFGLSNVAANDLFVIAIYDGLYFSRLSEGYSLAKRHMGYDQLNISSPLFQGVAVHDVSQNFYFGEYICGEKRPIRIIRISHDLDSVETAYTFAKGEVQHVHDIVYDKYLNRLWVTTGDSDEESAIYYSDDEFQTLVKLGGGDQTWRAVSVIPLKDGLVWGSDAGKDAREEDINHIYYYSYADRQKSKSITIGNPAYHSVIDVQGNIYIGVNYEPGRKQNTPEESSIWRFDGEKWLQIKKFSYKRNNILGCSKYGYIYFPKGVVPTDSVPYLALNNTSEDFATYLMGVSKNLTL
jgi:hypothetical protein